MTLGGGGGGGGTEIDWNKTEEKTKNTHEMEEGANYVLGNDFMFFRQSSLRLIEDVKRLSTIF